MWMLHYVVAPVHVRSECPLCKQMAGVEPGHAMQTAADVKARTPGLFGRLPPSLQRAGKDIFNQGRTVFNPIGRIFKGKVFPPFT